MRRPLPRTNSSRRCSALILRGSAAKGTTLTPSAALVCRDFRCAAKASHPFPYSVSLAADYQDEEYALFGKALKFAGLHGKEVRVIGKNRETLTTAKAAFVQ